MNIVVDYGNTNAKVGIFQDGKLRQKLLFDTPGSVQEFLQREPADHVIVSSVSVPADQVLSWSGAKGVKAALSHRLPLPVKILYRTPETLGVDRVAAVCGALEIFPGQDCLVIDAGTCITYEFLDRTGSYHGGSISPGVMMRFEAMHRFTSRLPKATPVHPTELIGDSTEKSLQSGVIHGVRAEVDGILAAYRNRYPGLKCILCGGDTAIFENPLNPGISVFPDLVLTGLDRILRNLAGT